MPLSWPLVPSPCGAMFTPRRTQLTNQVGGVSGFARNSAMPKRRVLEGAEDQERAKRRQQLGSLHSLTVQPATRRRYDKATEDFFSFLRKEKLVLPTKKEQLDPLVCDYLEHLWSTGVGRGQANDTVAGLQDIQPNLRHHLPGAWRLLKTWAVNEIPNRAPPIPEQVVQAMAGWAFFHGHNSFGVSLILGFYTMLRSGELLGLRSSHLLCSPKEKQVLVSLGMTKRWEAPRRRRVSYPGSRTRSFPYPSVETYRSEWYTFG